MSKTANHWLEPAKKFILDSKQAEIIVCRENLFEKKDWLEPNCAEAINAEHTIWLRRVEDVRTYYGKLAFAVDDKNWREFNNYVRSIIRIVDKWLKDKG